MSRARSVKACGRVVSSVTLDNTPYSTEYALPTVETWYSLLRSTISPQALIEAAQRRKMSALGIVDQATTLGHVPMAKAARDSGIHIAYGASLTLDDGHRLRVLARNETGYRNLCRLVSLQAGGQTTLAWQAIHDHRSGLYHPLWRPPGPSLAGTTQLTMTESYGCWHASRRWQNTKTPF